MSDRDILDTAKRRWKLVYEAEANQRQREKEDLSYQLPENQWSAAAKAERMGEDGRPARPMLSVSLVKQPMSLTRNQIASAQLGVNVHPVGENSSKEWAEIRQDLYRRIERDSNATVARLWAVDRALKCGRGWYRVDTKWDEDSDNSWDQEIVIRRLLHQDMVYMDPAAQEADFSDARWGFVAAWVPIDDFREMYPNAQIAASDSDFRSLIEQEPLWVRGDGDKRAVLVAEKFYKIKKVREVIEHPEQKGRKRELIDIAVKWCKLTGVEVLEEEDWAGHYIPLVPVLGEELQPIGGERMWEGMIRPARDAQMFFNSAITAAVERMWLEPKAPHILDPKQIEGYEQFWDQANRRNFPYLPYNMVSADGKLLPPPQRSQVDQTGTSLAMMGVELGRMLVQTATAVYDPGLGKESREEKSGRAILALQQQGDAGTSHYAWSMANTSMTYEARVGLDLMPVIYDRPGRITTVLGGEDETKTVMLGAPYVMDPRTGRPRQVREGTPGAKFYDLSQGRYSTSVSIGRSYQTRLQEGSEEIGRILEAAPDLMPIIGPTYFRFRDFPGAKEIADLLKKLRDMKFPGLADDKDQAMTVEQAQAKVAALEQQLREMQQALQQAMQQIQVDEAKQRAVLEKASLDAQTKLQLEQMEQRHEAIMQQMKLQAEAMQAALDRLQELKIHREEMAHEAALASAGGQTTTYSRTDGRETGEEREDESSRGQSREPAEEGE